VKSIPRIAHFKQRHVKDHLSTSSEAMPASIRGTGNIHRNINGARLCSCDMARKIREIVCSRREGRKWQMCGRVQQTRNGIRIPYSEENGLLRRTLPASYRLRARENSLKACLECLLAGTMPVCDA
jgi:hypothetical protein